MIGRGDGTTEAVRLDDLERAASGLGLEPVYQPVVTLADDATVGYEALARWPGLDDPDPVDVFSHAAATGRVAELDRACIDAAIDAILRRGLPPGTLLMLNSEGLSGYPGRSADSLLDRAHRDVQVMFELTERNLLSRPADLLRKVDRVRADGFGIALDDIGAHPDSLALLDIIRPELVKLDLHLVQSHPTDDQARIIAAVLAHKERTGSALLAEGIESAEHRDQALALGADLGQGFMFGRPGPLTGRTATPLRAPWTAHPAGPGVTSPFDFLAERVPVRTARKATLIPFSRHMEAQAHRATDPPMMLTALQRAEHFTAATRHRYRDIAASSPFVAVLGRGLPNDLGPGLRGVDLDSEDPLCGQWIVVVLGPHHASALVARERDASGSVREADRRFDLAITYDRELVSTVARSMLTRIV